MKMFRQFRLAAVFSLSFVLCDPAMAADQVVTINANSGAGSLRQAISDVTAGGNITFNLPAGNETITIASELSITKALTINGANASGSGVAVTVKVTTPGTSAWRVFTITASGSTINIQNMTMLGGSTGGSYGGVMQINSGATVSLTGITMSNGKSNYGGGVFLTGATTNLVVTNSTLSNNSTTGNHGGWVYNEGSYVEVNSCTFSGNTGVCGGAIFNAISSARLLVSSCEFTGNSGNGGAVYNEGTATITGSTIYGNTSTSIGGAITSWGTVTISSSTIFGNAATTDGGGIYKGGANDLIITSSTISGNTSGSNKGGGIFNITGSCYLLNSIIINNFASAGADLYNASGSTYAYYCWYHGTSGTISSQATAPDVTMAYSPGDLGVPLNNGGSTKTMEVSPASPAPDNGAFVYYNATDGYYFLDNQSTPVSHKLSAWATSPTVTPADKITADQRGITIGNLPTIGSYYLVPVHVASTLGTLSADYYTLHDAADAVNTGTHQGTITVTINGSIIETGSVVFNASGSGSSGYTSISIYPTATGLSVSGNMATPLIDLNGADNVTIDGRVNASGSAKDLTISNTNTSTTAGTSTIRFINDACANTVKYCILKGSSTATTNSGVIYFATAGSGPGNDNNTVDQNDITCALDANRLVNVIYAYGTSGKENSGNVISNNNIFNFMRRGAYSNGLLIYQNNTAYTVSGNSFYETTTFVPTASGGIYFMIWINNTGVNYIISGNYIGGTSASCGGSALTKTSSPQYDSEFNGIYLNTGAGSASNIQGNTIANITWNNSGNGRCTGIETEGGGDFNIGTTAANTIGASTGNGSLTYSYQTGGAFFYGMYLISHGTTIVSNNILGSITGANTSDHSTSVYGIYKPGYGTTTIINNSIGSTTTANSIQTSSTSIMDAQNVVGISCSGNAVISNNVIANLHNSSTAYEGQVAGISTSSGAFTVANNTVRDLSIANYNTYSENHASVIGICNWSNSNAHTISGNKIYNLSNTYNSFSGCIIGLFFNASSAGSTVSGNFIYGLAVAPGATDGNIYGIKIEGGATTYSNNIVSLVGNTRTTIYGIYETGISGNNNNFYFNTVYLGGTLASGSTNKSYALYSAVTTNTRDFRNNIFSNARSTTGGASLHYSAWFNYAVNTNLTLDYNDYYASGTGGVMGYYNSANATTLPLVTGNDANSISVNPNFPSAGGTLAANYKVTAGLPGTASGTGISTDFAGTARSLTAPTMGAYEYIPVIYYVKATGSDANDGLSWANAKATLQAALDLVVSTDQIWVAAGTYTPTSAYDLTNTPRYYHFRMKYGVSIYGGFAGTESAVSERTNFGAGQLHETKLSGDLLNNDNFDYANGGYQGTTGDDNCYHVIYNPTVLIPLLTNTAVLDGFTIKGGNATGGNTFNQGSGICNSGDNNSHQSNNPVIRNCIITRNYATEGAVYIGQECNSLNILNSTFTENYSESGGGVFTWECNPTITNTLFYKNKSIHGGAICFQSNILSTPSVINCTITGNTATFEGGGISNMGLSTNSSFRNCIIWGNTAEYLGNQIRITHGTAVTLNYSCYSNGAGDISNSSTFTATDHDITTNPQFVNSGGDDYRIKGYSPCADAGLDSCNSETFDIRGAGFGRKLNKSTGVAGTIDMGAYEFKSGTDPDAVLVTATSGPVSGYYGTLKAAFDAINAGTHQGTVTVTIIASTTETASAILNESSDPANYSSVYIYPASAGLNISGNLAAPLIDLNGTHNVTIDGRVNATGSVKDLTIINTSNSTACGTSTIRFINDACSNSVKYCTLKGSSLAHSSNWCGAIVYFSSGVASGNDDNSIDHNNITNATNRPICGVFSNGTAGAANSGNTISNNNLYDLLSFENHSSMIFIYLNNASWTINGNSFYDTGFNPSANYSYTAINILGSTDNTIFSNYIGGNAPLCSGTWTKTDPWMANQFIAIYVNATTMAGSTSIQGNTIKNFNWSNLGLGWTGIQVYNGNFNIGTQTGNIIGSSAGNGSIQFSCNLDGFSFCGIDIATGGTVDCRNNTIGAVIVSATDAASSTGFYGIRKGTSGGTTTISNNIIGSTTTDNSIYASSASTGRLQWVYGIYSQGTATTTISGNTISKMTNGTTNTTDATAGTIQGIYKENGANTISSNTIRDLSIANSNTASDHTASAIGICLNYSTAGNVQVISGNNIFNLSNTYGPFAGNVTGLYYNGSTTAATVSENFIHSLLVTGGSSNAASINGIKINAGATTYANNIISLGGNTQTTIYGIYETGTSGNNNNLYFNTVYLGGTLESGSPNKSYALYSAVTTNTRDIRNNIFSNTRSTSGGSGLHYPIYIVSTGGSLTCDYNDYYAPGTGGIFGFYGEDKPVLPIVTGASGNDVHSQGTDPLFASAGSATATGYLPSAPTLAGTPGTGIQTDYDGNTRSIIYPAMGAWEYPVSPPCGNPTNGGTIAASQTGCSPFNPSTITSVTTPTGHTGTLEYKWQCSVTSSSGGFSDASGSFTSTTYTPGALTVTTWYKRLSKVTCEGTWTVTGESNVLTITVNETPTAAISGTASVCFGSDQPAVTFTGDHGSSPYTFYYKVNEASTVSVTTTSGSSATVSQSTSASGTYTYTLISVSDANGCSQTQADAVTVHVFDQLVAGSVTASQTICLGATASTLTATVMTGGSGYPAWMGYQWQEKTTGEWADINGASSMTYDPGSVAVTTIYRQKQTDYFCTQQQELYTNEVTITVNPLPVPAISGTSTVCTGATGVTYSTGSGMNGYSWSVSAGGTIDNGTGTHSITVTWNTPGAKNLSVTYTDLNGCIPATPTVKSITVNSLPVATINGTGSVAIYSNHDYTTEAGMTSYSWVVTPSTGSITTGQGTRSVTIHWGDVGLHIVTVTYEDGNGCSPATAAQFTVTVDPLPPTVTSDGHPDEVTAITATSATGNGQITATNGSLAISRGYIYYLYDNTDKLIGDAGVTNVSVTGSFGVSTYTSDWTGLSVNTHYNARAHATNSAGAGYATCTAFWTLANVPAAPTVSSPTATTLKVTVHVNGNPAITRFAIHESSTDQYLQANGTLATPTAAWLTAEQWGTMTVTGLTTGTTYTFCMKARNGAGSETAFGDCASGITCTNPTSGGEIAASQSICYGNTPEAFTSITPASGQAGALEYKWQSSVTSSSVGFTDIASSNTETYAPGTLTRTTWYKRMARVTCKIDWAGAAESNILAILVNPILPVNIVIAPNANPSCEANQVTFFAFPTNGGQTPQYQWNVNGTSTGGNNSSFSYVPSNGDVVYCVMTSSVLCPTGSPATSNIVLMTVRPLQPLSVSVNASSNPVCATTPVTYRAKPVNGGPAPSYQWMVNGTGVGSNNPVFTYTPANGDVITCVLTSAEQCATGNPAISNAITMTVNPLPTVNTVSDQVLCAGSATSPVIFTGTPAGTYFNWINYNPSIGLGPNGTGNIPSFTAINPGNAPSLAGIGVVPLNNSGGLTCPGYATYFNITVNPIPDVDPVSSQIVCRETLIPAIAFSGSVPGTQFSWTNSNPGIGLPGSGTGNIGPFIATNPTSTQMVATITIRPSYGGGSAVCQGAATTFTITVNPATSVNPVASQVLCAGTKTDPVIFTGSLPGTVYNWTNSNPEIGLAASGAGDIGSFTVINNAVLPAWATVTVTPVYISGSAVCNGSPATFTITVKPVPVPIITGPEASCARYPFNDYSTVSGLNYQWTVSSGGIITLGGSPQNAYARITWNTAGAQWIGLNYTNSYGCSSVTPKQYNVTVNPLPEPAITGPAVVFLGSGVVTYTTEPSMTNYTWNISVGGTVAAGGSATDNFVTVMWTATGEETVSVNYSNEQGCSAWQQTSLAVTVLSVPVILEVQNVTVTGGQNRCYDAIQTITVAGNGTTFLEHGGGSATFIAGQNILYLPGTRVETGGYMHGIIAPNGPFCGMLAPSIANTEVLMTNDKLPMTNEEGNGWFKVYPNPTDGKFTVEYTGKTQPGRITVEIYGMNGDKILSEAFPEERFHEFTLNGRPIGIYLIRMVTDGTTSTGRILKR